MTHLGLSLPLLTSELPMCISTPSSHFLVERILVISITDTLYTPSSWSLHHGLAV